MMAIPHLTLGCGYFGHADHHFQIGRTTATRLVDACLDSGINCFDTADVYGDGASEEMLGKILYQKRSKAFIISKVGGFSAGAMEHSGLSRAHIMESCDKSLRRLRSDYIDVYLAHQFDSQTPIAETLDAFAELKREGKIRAFGVSNFTAIQLSEVLRYTNSACQLKCDFIQNELSFVFRDQQDEISSLCARHQIGWMAYSPLAGGLLVKNKKPIGRWAERDITTIQNMRGSVKALSWQTGISPVQAALQWVLAQRGVITVIIGPRNEAQLRDCLGIFNLQNRPVLAPVMRE